MLAAMSGVESQLMSHIGISMNTGLRREQLPRLADVLEARVSRKAVERVRAAVHP
ncbi:hypothetical protein [Stenotrophomonas sp.]|uniref:hypothetical protein n=1 Tax=Stenotrophomonas sp. TaxID=69392 RepID=UPI0028A0F948|nr:hypothetical protein [Stenotrophomonas sp.]